MGKGEWRSKVQVKLGLDAGSMWVEMEKRKIWIESSNSFKNSTCHHEISRHFW